MELFSTIGMGIITGLVGPIITGITNYKMKKLDNEAKIKDREFQIKLLETETANMIKEAEIGLQVTKVTNEGEIEKMETEAFKESIKSFEKEKSLFQESYMQILQKSIYTSWIAGLICLLFGIVDWLKGMARPAITYYLIGCSTWITIMAYRIVEITNGQLDAGKAQQLFADVCMTIIYLTVSCVTWWFGDRRVAKFINSQLTTNKNRKGVNG